MHLPILMKYQKTHLTELRGMTFLIEDTDLYQYVFFEGWQNLVFAERNTDLITEHRQQAETDHVMVYLSRNPGTSSAFVKWKFNFTDAGKETYLGHQLLNYSIIRLIHVRTRTS